MTNTQRTFVLIAVAALATAGATVAAGEPLTVERAVEMALQRSTSVVNSEADVLTARGSLYGAYSGVLPTITAGLSRSGSWERAGEGTRYFGTFRSVTPLNDTESYSTSPSLSLRWTVLDLSSLASLRAAQTGLRAAHHARAAVANDVIYSTRGRFYEVVKAVRLADVSASALRLSRDNERRVRALFEVGSVSRSDLLKAQVQTAQSELDSLTAAQSVTTQRVLLAEQLGVGEAELGEVDTVLTVQPVDYDESELVSEASRNRPDLLAADAQLKSAEASLRSANLARLPYVSINGGTTFQPRSNGKTTFDQAQLDGNGDPYTTTASNSRADLDYNASVSINMNLFTGFGTESQIATARARVMRARESRDALRRNLASEVHQAILSYRQAVESDRVARRAIESATENLKLTQQKYNVGSATILDLIDAQVQLQRAQSQGVTALAGIRVAEAAVERVRGGGAR